MNISEIILKKILKKIKIKKKNQLKLNYSNKEEFGDYQINGVISISKQVHQTPYELAKKIKKYLNSENFIKKIKITHNGFVNIFLKTTWIEKKIEKIINTNKLIDKKIKKQTIIIDYSSPNTAKEMHVGHLRSTVIGDSIANIMDFLGHKVIRINHIGDWGTPFGMLIAYLKKNNKKEKIDISKIEKYYKNSKKLYDENEKFANLSRKYVRKLQSGEKKYYEIWKKINNISINENQKIYKKLNINLKKKNIMGESFYNNMLPDIISDLIKKKIAKENNGAIIAYCGKKDTNKIIIKKKDGAYLYSTTDLACMKYRYEILKADKILYYVDHRQNEYFKNIIYIAKKAKYISKKIQIEHHTIGMVLKKNKKPFQSRSGENIKLKNLLDEGIKKAKKLIIKKNKEIKEKELELTAKKIGIGAIKYLDLSKNRKTNYIFNLEKTLNFEGNTALYIQYAYVRINSILKKQKKTKKTKNKILLNNEYERKLAIFILKFEETIITVSKNGFPHIICNYLYKITNIFSKFYENCPIIKINDKKIKNSRLELLILTKKILKIGLNLLGIKTIKKI